MSKSELKRMRIQAPVLKALSDEQLADISRIADQWENKLRPVWEITVASNPDARLTDVPHYLDWIWYQLEIRSEQRRRRDLKREPKADEQVP